MRIWKKIFSYVLCICLCSLCSIYPIDAKVQHKQRTKQRPQYSNLYLLSHVIFAEAGGSSYKDQLYVGSVVLNRVADKRFPNTIQKVIFSPRQYSCVNDGNFDKTPSKTSIKIAKYLLKHGSQLPRKVIWQSQAKLGRVYKKVNKHYYCF